jgi:hypothetical protein
MKRLIYSGIFLSLLLSAAPALAQAPGTSRESGSVVQSIFDSLERMRESRTERARQREAERTQDRQNQEGGQPQQPNTNEQEQENEGAAATSSIATSTASAKPDTPAIAQAAAPALSALGEQNGTPQAGVYEAPGLSATQMQLSLTAALAMAVAGFLLIERRTLESLLSIKPARHTHSLRV